MYTVDNNTPSEALIASAGINDNYKLVGVSYASPKKDGSGDCALLFNFIGPKGEQFRHVEFPIDETKENAASKAQSMAKRIKHILSKFVPEEKIIITGENFEQFCKAVIGILGNNYKTIPVRIKLVYNDSGKLSFTRYTPFIERMDAEKSNLVIGKNENITVPTNNGANPPTPVSEEAF